MTDYDGYTVAEKMAFFQQVREFKVRLEGLVRREFGIHANIGSTEGDRFVRVYKDWSGQKTVMCFVDKSDGTIFKGSWKAPVKNGARGNIYADDFGMECMDAYGCKPIKKGRPAKSNEKANNWVVRSLRQS